jgi:23S rRNA (adenine2030-N6)-methyltransferase
MNYRHHFHAGNFADVFKHALLVQLVLGLQKKEKGFLYLDTHAGRGRYDLTVAAFGDTLARVPEHPNGIGRLWTHPKLPPALEHYVGLVRAFDRSNGNLGGELRYYPGSPELVSVLARPQDRLVLCEMHPEDFGSLDACLGGQKNVAVHATDGYTAVRAMLPPPERRALILIDPPFEEKKEFGMIAHALAEGLRRFSSGTFAVWYPLTERARVDDFLAETAALHAEPMFAAELTVVGPESALKMKGCGLLVINPPWQVDRQISSSLPVLREALAQEPGGEHRLRWLVPET